VREVVFRVNDASPLYPYQQLASHLRERIASGDITDRLPSLTDLVEESGLSMGAVQRAVKVLKREGLVEAVHGRGMFVRKDGP
jgi:GntR family transcriptional regulator